MYIPYYNCHSLDKPAGIWPYSTTPAAHSFPSQSHGTWPFNMRMRSWSNLDITSMAPLPVATMGMRTWCGWDQVRVSDWQSKDLQPKIYCNLRKPAQRLSHCQKTCLFQVSLFHILDFGGVCSLYILKSWQMWVENRFYTYLPKMLTSECPKM